MSIKRICNFFLADPNDPTRYRKYYENETFPIYKYIIDNQLLGKKHHVLEVGCGGGVFYEEYEQALTHVGNRYTSIDIDAESIRISKQNCNYVDFIEMDIHDYKSKRLKDVDIMLMVQVYICVPNIDKAIKRYFRANPNGKLIIVNTILPDYLIGISNVFRDTIMKKWFNMNWGKSLKIEDMISLSKRIKRNLTYKIISHSPMT
jgi:2-polyprenyl-3-methyl-5-hydroxy-6-metoxy-1,4-benzoquinol methylase